MNFLGVILKRRAILTIFPSVLRGLRLFSETKELFPYLWGRHCLSSEGDSEDGEGPLMSAVLCAMGNRLTVHSKSVMREILAIFSNVVSQYEESQVLASILFFFLRYKFSYFLFVAVFSSYFNAFPFQHSADTPFPLSSDVMRSSFLPRLLDALRRYLSALLSSPRTTKRFLSSHASASLLLSLLSLARKIVCFASDEKSSLLFCRLLLPFLRLPSLSEDVRGEVFGLFDQSIAHIDDPGEFVRPIVYLFEGTRAVGLRRKLCSVLVQLQEKLGPQSLTIGNDFFVKYYL